MYDCCLACLFLFYRLFIYLSTATIAGEIKLIYRAEVSSNVVRCHVRPCSVRCSMAVLHFLDGFRV